MTQRMRQLFSGSSSKHYDVTEWTKDDEKLMQAIRKKDIDKVQALLKKGVMPIKIHPDHGISCFHQAAGDGDPTIVSCLLKDSPGEINTRDSEGKTLLHHAVQKGRREAAQQLIKAGADVNLVDYETMSLMHYASSCGHLDCVTLLINNQAPVDMTDKYGQTPLLSSAWKGQATVARLLLQNGASVNRTDNSGNTPLIMASMNGHAALCDYLIRNGADMNSTDFKGHNALWHSIDKERADVRRIIEQAQEEKRKSTAELKRKSIEIDVKEFPPPRKSKVKMEEQTKEELLASELSKQKKDFSAFPGEKFDDVHDEQSDNGHAYDLPIDYDDTPPTNKRVTELDKHASLADEIRLADKRLKFDEHSDTEKESSKDTHSSSSNDSLKDKYRHIKYQQRVVQEMQETHQTEINEMKDKMKDLEELNFAMEKQISHADLDRHNLHQEGNQTKASRNWLIRELTVLHDNIKELHDSEHFEPEQIRTLEGLQNHVEYMLKTSELERFLPEQSSEEPNRMLGNKMLAVKLERLTRENRELQSKLKKYHSGSDSSDDEKGAEKETKLFAESYRKLKSEIDFNDASELLVYVKDSFDEISTLQAKTKQMEQQISELNTAREINEMVIKENEKELEKTKKKKVPTATLR